MDKYAQLRENYSITPDSSQQKDSGFCSKILLSLGGQSCMDNEPVGAPPVSLTAVLVINSASAMAIKGILVSVFSLRNASNFIGQILALKTEKERCLDLKA